MLVIYSVGFLVIWNTIYKKYENISYNEIVIQIIFVCHKLHHTGLLLKNQIDDVALLIIKIFFFISGTISEGTVIILIILFLKQTNP